MKKKLLLISILFLSFLKTNAVFECNSKFCNDSNQKSTPWNLYYLSDYFIAETKNTNEYISIKNIIWFNSFSLINNLKLLTNSNKFKYTNEIIKYYKNNPTKYVILRKDWDSNTINALFKIKCESNNFIIESDNQKIPFKENFFQINSCKNIENMILIEKIKLFLLIFWFIFMFLFFILKFKFKNKNNNQQF